MQQYGDDGKPLWTPTFFGPSGDQADQSQQEQRKSGGLHSYERVRSTPQGREVVRNRTRKEKQVYALQGPIGESRSDFQSLVESSKMGGWIVGEAVASQ